MASPSALNNRPLTHYIFFWNFCFLSEAVFNRQLSKFPDFPSFPSTQFFSHFSMLDLWQLNPEKLTKGHTRWMTSLQHQAEGEVGDVKKETKHQSPHISNSSKEECRRVTSKDSLLMWAPAWKLQVTRSLTYVYLWFLKWPGAWI